MLKLDREDVSHISHNADILVEYLAFNSDLHICSYIMSMAISTAFTAPSSVEGTAIGMRAYIASIRQQALSKNMPL